MTNIGWIARRTLAVARREGLLGTLERIVKYVRLMLGIPSAEIREYRRFKAEADQAFDEEWGVDTGGTQLLAELTIDSPNAALGGSHIATGPRQFHRAMSGLDIDPANCTFVDLGSGKGRALMMAADYPFAAITGVEFAEELDAIARRNLARLGDPRVTCHLGDAEEFDYRPTDLVVFMNNPFDPPLVERIARRLEATLRDHPRTVRVVYINPCTTDAFARPPWFHVAEVSGGDVFGLGAAS
jgi:SAM-dependent methyltransferase